MTTTLRYYIDGYLLNVDRNAYLVTVRPANGDTGRYAKKANLPEWVFKSKHAIWLTEGNDPLPGRAIHGEEIKRQLMVSYNIGAHPTVGKEVNHENTKEK